MKKTKKELFKELLALAEVQANKSFVEFIEHEVELLEKKKGKDGKPTASQLANDVIKTNIINVLSTGIQCQLKNMGGLCPELASYTTQKLSSLANQLVKQGTVGKYTVNSVTYFFLVTEDVKDLDDKELSEFFAPKKEEVAEKVAEEIAEEVTEEEIAEEVAEEIAEEVTE